MDLDELAISFLGRTDVAALWERLRAGTTVEMPHDRVLVLLAESRAHERAGRLAEACASAQRALDDATDNGDEIGRAGGLSHLAYARYRLGEGDEACRLAERALEVDTPHPHTVTALFVLGLVALDGCRWDEARDRFTQARSWSAAIDYPLGLMLALHNLSVVYFHTGKFDMSLSAADDVGRLNREIRYPGWAYPWTRAIVSQIAGDRATAREAIDELLHLQPPAAFATGLALMLRAQLALDEEDVDAAEALLVAARLEAGRLGNPLVRTMVLLVTSRVRRARGDAASAQGWIDEAVDEARRGGLASLDGWLQLERARVRWDLGDVDAARQILLDARRDADARSAAHVGAEAAVLLAALGGHDHEWLDAAARVRHGGYGFILERDRSLVVPRVAALARDPDPGLREAAQHMLDQLARVAPVGLRVAVLGRFEIQQGRRIIPTVELRKRRAGELFRFLLLQRDHRAQRDVVIEALWPGQQAGKVQALFHQASSALRRTLEPDLPDKFPSRYLRIGGDSIQLILPPGSVVDADEFERQASAALLSTAPDPAALGAILDAYGGELMPDDRYADWSAQRRERLADRAAAVGERHAALLLANGEALAALEAAEAVLERDPLRERAVETAMLAALALGDRVGSARRYRQFEAALTDQLDIRPSAALRRLAAGLED